jgi:hypothetical protein
MRIIPSNNKIESELPLKHKISFEAIFEYLENIAKDENHVLNSIAVKMLGEYKNYPELRDGFEDSSYLEKYNVEIDRLLDFLFPELLQSNEIKAASIPFEFTTFKLSKRFETILDEAGEAYHFELRNYATDNIYIMACTLFWHIVMILISILKGLFITIFLIKIRASQNITEPYTMVTFLR